MFSKWQSRGSSLGWVVWVLSPESQSRCSTASKNQGFRVSYWFKFYAMFSSLSEEGGSHVLERK